jgi:mannose-6-phosphate isomerase
MNKMDLYPLTFTPRFLPKIWGGRKLESFLGKDLPGGALIGESWEVCDRPEFSSPVAEGPLKGLSLRQVLLEFGPHLVGQALYRQGLERFPLLVKYIDAADDLSVQVHPDDDYAALRTPSDPGKTEVWVLLQADAQAQVVAGIRPGTDRQSFSRALGEGRIESLLNRFQVKEGDAIFVPAGRVHALGKGCLVAEIQQNSDTTYRIFDYGRLENGKPRPLHLSQALETIRFDPEISAMPNLIEAKSSRSDDFSRNLLVTCPYFTVEQVAVHPAFSPNRTEDSFHLLMVKKGKGTLHWSGSKISLSPGKTILVPANLEWRVTRETEDLQLIWVRK